MGDLLEFANPLHEVRKVVRTNLLVQAASLAKYMNSEPEARARETSLSRSSCLTSATKLTSRFRTASINAPTAQEVNNAVNVAVYGRKSQVNVNTAQVAGEGPASVTSTPAGQSKPWWRRAKTIGGFIVGVAVIATAIMTWMLVKG